MTVLSIVQAPAAHCERRGHRPDRHEPGAAASLRASDAAGRGMNHVFAVVRDHRLPRPTAGRPSTGPPGVP